MIKTIKECFCDICGERVQKESDLLRTHVLIRHHHDQDDGRTRFNPPVIGNLVFDICYECQLRVASHTEEGVQCTDVQYHPLDADAIETYADMKRKEQPHETRKR